MKLRTNYVSNSSSSSFIVSYQPDKKIILKHKENEIEFNVKDFMNEIESKYESHSECTMMLEKGAKAIYEEAKEWWDEDDLKQLKIFLDKNPDDLKVHFQINYDDTRIKKKLLNLMKMGLIDVLADEYALRNDC